MNKLRKIILTIAIILASLVVIYLIIKKDLFVLIPLLIMATIVMVTYKALFKRITKNYEDVTVNPEKNIV